MQGSCRAACSRGETIEKCACACSAVGSAVLRGEARGQLAGFFFFASFSLHLARRASWGGRRGSSCCHGSLPPSLAVKMHAVSAARFALGARGSWPVAHGPPSPRLPPSRWARGMFEEMHSGTSAHAPCFSAPLEYSAPRLHLGLAALQCAELTC